MIAASSLKVLTAAKRLVEQARRGELASRQADVFRQVQSDPRRAMELLIVLAELVASERPPLVDEARMKHLRLAHAAYARGERWNWVIDGEREYQRNKKRLYRHTERRAATTEKGAA